MDITDVRIRTMDNGGRMKAVASVTFDDEFVVHDIKIVEGEKGYFVAMPSKRVGDTFKDVAHPLLAETRKKISDAIFEKYKEIEGVVVAETTSE
jgi:stage V sporulation protein G